VEVQEEILKRFPGLEPMALKNPLDPVQAPATSIWLWPQAVRGNGMFICAWRKAKDSTGTGGTV
jgi:hypothetical protein